MQTTIRVDEHVAALLGDVKKSEKAKSYNEVILKLLEKQELSMFGADKKLKKWSEAKDRARFR